MVIWSYLNVSNILIGGTAVPTRFCRCTMNRGKVHIQYPAKKEKRKVQTVLSGASAHSPFNRWLTCLVRSVTQPDPTLSGTRNDFCIIDAKQKSPALVVRVVWHWCRRAFMGGEKKSIETAAGSDRVIPKLSSPPLQHPSIWQWIAQTNFSPRQEFSTTSSCGSGAPFNRPATEETALGDRPIKRVQIKE